MAATTRGFQKFGCLVIFLITLISIQFWVILSVQNMWAVVVAQMAEQSLPTPEDPISNPVLDNFAANLVSDD